MPEKFEVGFYEFIRSELSNLESRIDRRFAEMEGRTEKRFDQVDIRFNKLEEEVRWPRRIATAGVITTVIAVFFAIAGFTK